MLGFSEIRSRATTFAYEWREANYEMGQSQSFWIDFFTCFGISPKRVATFEERVKKLDGKTGRIDMLWKGVLLIEQKSRGQDLDKAYTQAMECGFATINAIWHLVNALVCILCDCR